jgi:hypothetical protein
MQARDQLLEETVISAAWSGAAFLAALALASAPGNARAQTCFDSATIERQVRASPVARRIDPRIVAPPPTRSTRIVALPSLGRVVAAVTRSGPPDGVLALLRCDAHVVAVQQVGYVFGITTPVSPQSSAALILIDEQSGAGSGWTRRSATLFAVTGNRLQKVWSGVTAESSYQADAVGSYEIQAQVTVRNDSLLRIGSRFPLHFVRDGGAGRWVRDSAGASPIHEAVALKKIVP